MPTAPRPLRVAIDCSCMAKAERTGVARYCSSVVEHLPEVLGPDDRVVQLYRLSRIRRPRFRERVQDPRFRTSILNDRLLRIHPAGIDVVHGPDVRIPDLPGVPAVSTVHDLSALDVEGIAGEDFRRRKACALEDVARRAAVILCVSEFTQDALLRRFPECRGRTRVVPLGLSPKFRPEEPARVREVLAARRLRSPYVLFVGQVSARKNLLPLVEAFGRLHAADPALDLDLVLAGPLQTGGDDVLAAVQRLHVAARVHRLGFAGDDTLPALYTGASAFVFPGKAEGFGMPSLEAMACGCPVVAARAGGNVSTVADAGFLVDPDDPAALVEALRQVLAPGSLRDDLIARGRSRAARFTWQETARRTVEAYRHAACAGAIA